MIVNARDGGWEVAFQRAHAWLAHQLLLPFRPTLRTPRWPQVLVAALVHDHGWKEWRDAELDSEGRPSSFIGTPARKATLLCRRACDLASYQDRGVAILVARHLEYLYGDREEPYLAEAVAQLHQRRRSWIDQLGWQSEWVERDYEFVLWADSASLSLCVDHPEFVNSLKLHLDGRDFALKRRGARESWQLEPWPYQEPEVRVEMDTLLLGQRTFTDPEHYRRALAGATRARRSWTLTALAG